MLIFLEQFYSHVHTCFPIACNPVSIWAVNASVMMSISRLSKFFQWHSSAALLFLLFTELIVINFPQRLLSWKRAKVNQAATKTETMQRRRKKKKKLLRLAKQSTSLRAGDWLHHDTAFYEILYSLTFTPLIVASIQMPYLVNSLSLFLIRSKGPS